MKDLLPTSIVLVFCCLSQLIFANSVPEVSNVVASQRTDGSGIVDIYYMLNDADGDDCSVSILVSDNGGSRWDALATNLSGDIGENISSGQKHIVWNSKTDLRGEYGENYQVKVTADDGVTGEPTGMVWVSINDPGVAGHEPFNGEMSKYEVTNAQYCEFLNTALASGDITVEVDAIVYGTSGLYSGQNYYNISGIGVTYDGVTHGGLSRINWTGSSFTVDSGFDNHPVNHVSWYGSSAFASYYGYRLPTEWEWQAVADYTVAAPYAYGCGTSINNSKANYLDSTHPNGTTIVGSFGSYGYGMCDMAGNVFEWTSTVSSGKRVVRGGSWFYDDNYCTVSYRLRSDPSYAYLHLGFRVCR